MTFRRAVTGTDPLAALRALRNQIVLDLENCESMRDRASLYLRLTDVLAKIQAMSEPATKGDAVDEIAQRRTSRRASAATRKTRATRSG